MLQGVGVDLVAINRIEKVMAKHGERFLKRIFCNAERKRFRGNNVTAKTVAARFAAKEACLKAIGCGIGPAAMKEVEIRSRPGEQPKVILHGEALKEAAKKNITGLVLSMTHEAAFACAVAAAYTGSPDSSEKKSGSS